MILLLAFIWGMLGAAIPIGLDGVSNSWWVLPLINIILAMIPFLLPYPLTIIGSLFAFLLALGTVLQYSIGQHSWVAAVMSSPYLLWTIIMIILVFRIKLPVCVAKNQLR